SSRRRHTRSYGDWSSDVCSSDLISTKPAWTVRQVAQYLSVNERTVYCMPDAGKLPAFKVADAWRFLRDDIYDWVMQKQRQRAGKIGRASCRERWGGAGIGGLVCG